MRYSRVGDECNVPEGSHGLVDAVARKRLVFAFHMLH